MATLLKVLNNLADIKSARGVALRVRTQGALSSAHRRDRIPRCRLGAKLRTNSAPATADAEIVAALRLAGAVILGKTHTTEFAYFDPSPVRNPHNIAHTPGGSPSGSIQLREQVSALAADAVPIGP
jgi:hypothetical protein